MRAVFPLRPSGLLPMLDRRLPERAAGHTQAMTTRSLYATWRRGEVVLKWGAVLLGASIPVSVVLDNVLLGVLLFFWLIGRNVSRQARVHSRQPGFVARAGTVGTVRRGVSVLDRNPGGCAGRVGESHAPADDPGAHLPAARPRMARARHRRVPRIDARDPRVVVPPLARSRSRQRMDQGHAIRARWCSRRTSRTTCSWHSPRSCSPRRRSTRTAGARGSRSASLRRRERQRAADGARPHRHARARRPVRLFPRARLQGQGPGACGRRRGGTRGDRPRIAG